MRREILDRGLMDIQSRTAFNDWVHRVSSCGGSEELVWRDSARRAQRNNSGFLKLPRLTVNGLCRTSLFATSAEPPASG
jgi:hypothetical protein